MTAVDIQYMSRALHLAEQGLYSTDPNPRVGAVLVKAGKIIAEAWHQTAGAAHAEIIALQQAGSEAQGATLYVSLEPCNHQGKTPPCTEAVIKAGIAKVVIAMQDPNPLVAGKGIARLKQAGIAVDCGVLESQARGLNPGFIKRMTQGKPWVRCKLAMSVDGRVAMASGESQWITGAAARQDVQHWRARSSAVITGINSILTDDPQLNVRQLKDAEIVRQPYRVILDSQLRITSQAKVLATPGAWVVTRQQDAKKILALQQQGAEVLVQPHASIAIDLDWLLKTLAQRECNEILIEAGPKLAGAWVQQQLVDELIIYMAPTLLGSEAKPLLSLSLQHLAEQIKLTIVDWRFIGNDIRMLATFKNKI